MPATHRGDQQNDFSAGTSSRSTKLIHGGVRYLQQGNVSLVLEALKERGILRRNAPHLVHDLPFIVPTYDWWEGPFYGIGLKLYDMLAGKEGFGPSQILSVEKTLEKIPTVETEGLRGGVIYHDGQFDDSRLVINLAQTAAEQGGTLVNYIQVTGLIKKNGLVTIAGGKWTTYRKMAEETLDQALVVARLKPQPSVSETLQIHGYHHHADRFGNLKDYGSDALEIERLAASDARLKKTLTGGFVLGAEVVWAVRYEMARTVEDFLARRRRSLFLDARAAMAMAPEAAGLMAMELKKGTAWQEAQVESFRKKARNYLLTEYPLT